MTELKRTLAEEVYYPAHDPRKASPEYAQTHHRLVVDLDEPCWICGIRNSDVHKLAEPDRRHWQIETHHAELEWAAAAAFDISHPQSAKAAEQLAKLTADHAEIANDPDRLRDWLDSDGNMLILCATHHRGVLHGIHSITYPVWKLQRYQIDGGWQFVR